MSTGLVNNAEGGSNGTVVTAANSGGTGQNAFTSVGGSPTFSSTNAAHGSLSYRLATSSDSLTWTQASVSDGFGRAYVYLNSSSSSVDITGQLAGTSIWRILIGGLSLAIDTGGFVSEASGSAPPIGAWFRCEWHHNATAQLVAQFWTTSMDSSGSADQILTAAANTNSNVDTIFAFSSTSVDVTYLDDLNAFATSASGPVGGGGGGGTTSPQSLKRLRVHL